MQALRRSNYLKLQQNEHAILQAMKAMDQKLTTHAESVAKVLILTAQKVDRLHNILREMGQDLEDLKAEPLSYPVLQEGPSGESAEGGTDGGNMPLRMSLKTMNPLLKSSDMQALVDQQGALGRESSVDEALRAIAREQDVRNAKGMQREVPSSSSSLLPTVLKTEDEHGLSTGDAPKKVISSQGDKEHLDANHHPGAKPGSSRSSHSTQPSMRPARAP